MSRQIARLIGAAALMTALAAIVTWPQALHMSTGFATHQDPYFSMWRFAWFAHALVTSPLHLLDANIFHPATRTLLFSDAMLLESAVAAPFVWAGVPTVLIYNVLLFAGFVGSGVAMFVLAHYLTRSTGAALVAGAVFTLAPYRVEHVMHLELQWVMWVPLTLWALHRAVDESSWRFGVAAGVFIWLQVLSCVYYGVFLAILLAGFVPVLLLTSGRKALYAVPALAAAAGVAAVLVLPYAWPYASLSKSLGPRPANAVTEYSATPLNYLASSSSSWLWGWTADRWGGPEVRLFPGLVAMVLALIGILARPRKLVLLYIVVTAVAVVGSFGLRTSMYAWLFERVGLLQGLRSPSRFGILAMCGIAMLAALGLSRLEASGRGRGVRQLTLMALLLLALESAVRPSPLTAASVVSDSAVYKTIRSSAPGVVLELPMPRADGLPGPEYYYQIWSTHHWNRLVNGYSGYYPIDYLRTLASVRTFPDDASMARLRAHNVRYIIVHRELFEANRYNELMVKIAERREIRWWGNFPDPLGTAGLFVLEPAE